MRRQERIRILQKNLKETGFSGALLFYSRDIYYYTGTAQPACLLVLPDDYTLFVRGGYDFALQDIFIHRERLRQERRIENIAKVSGLSGAAGKPLGTELDILTVEQFEGIRKAFPGFDFVNITPLLLEQRKRKEPEEIERIRKSCEALHAGHGAILDNLREGITELELSAVVENAHRLAGHEGIFFIRQPDFYMSRGPIASGPNIARFSGVVYTVTGVGLSPSVPAGPSMRKIAKGDMIVVDIPTHVRGYHADQSRTYCLGKASGKMRSLYEDLKQIADHVIPQMKAGMKGGDICRIAFEKASSLNRAGEFQSFGSGRYSRLVGHGVGIELNEPPILSANDTSVLDNDYVVTLELHMMDEQGGVVKLEDMIHIREGGNAILTRSPRALSEIER
ncbi:MAG TPA: Xaa-Pro peptidase family protein [Syntrophales bacterium]|jgi:Xaa-Pro aminopeptidase|nr:Xaa-Pro peptidase family protein [Syntrophales bacterium]